MNTLGTASLRRDKLLIRAMVSETGTGLSWNLILLALVSFRYAPALHPLNPHDDHSCCL